jgi:phosphate transport system substrate-binding protein
MLSVLLAVAALTPAVQAEELRLEGSTTVGPIADAFVNAFKEMYPGFNATVKKTGSGDGAAALVDKRCDIATMSRSMKAKEYKKAVDNGVKPVAHAVAMDGVCVVVHPSNPISELTTQQVRDIYKGNISNWKQLGGPDKKIIVISRDTSSGTYETFHKLAMKKEKMGSGTEYVNSNPQAHTRVSTTPGAIGYVGLGFVDQKVKALKLDGVTPSKKTIASGTYPISRPLFFYTDGYPKLGTKIFEFCTFYLKPDGQDIIEAKGFVPLTEY